MLGIYDDSFIKEYKEFTDKIHDLGAKIIMQIVYGGFMTGFNTGERTIWGPSTMQNEVTKVWAKEMTKDEIKYLVNAFAEAARRVKESGFDGVEIHAGHGYMLSQFLSPYYNKRTDEYGGTIENRERIIFEIFQAMREKVGKDFPILIKLNSADYINEGGLTKEDSLYLTIICCLLASSLVFIMFNPTILISSLISIIRNTPTIIIFINSSNYYYSREKISCIYLILWSKLTWK